MGFNMKHSHKPFFLDSIIPPICIFGNAHGPDTDLSLLVPPLTKGYLSALSLISMLHNGVLCAAYKARCQAF